MRWRVLSATCRERGASLSTIETVETESSQARATSDNVTCPDSRLATTLSSTRLPAENYLTRSFFATGKVTLHSAVRLAP